MLELPENLCDKKSRQEELFVALVKEIRNIQKSTTFTKRLNIRMLYFGSEP
jgi:hypothetical protein